MLWFLIIIIICYSSLILFFSIGFDKVPNFKLLHFESKISFTIVIPFRNEARNLPSLLDAISKLYYPHSLFEVYLVNDASTDHFKADIEKFTKLHPTLNLHLINRIAVSNSPKKDAIDTAIKKSSFDWILTTDADCVLPVYWLQAFNEFIINKDSYFISGPVEQKKHHSILDHFQHLNFLSLIGTSIGSFGLKKPILCNGANLGYRKDIYLKLNGFQGNLDIASGDDIFLLEKMIKTHPEKTHYLKSLDACVKTTNEINLKNFFNQQLRWASKTTSYTNNFSKFVAMTVFLQNLSFIVLGFLSVVNIHYFNHFLLALLIKLTVDFILIYKTSKFLGNTKSLKYFSVMSLLYPFFSFIIGSLSLFRSYEWKGRKFKQ